MNSQSSKLIYLAYLEIYVSAIFQHTVVPKIHLKKTCGFLHMFRCMIFLHCAYKAHGWETFPKCGAKFGYQLILGLRF